MIVDVPVNVIEKELQVAKNEASQQINQVTQQKLDEIDKDQSLTENKRTSKSGSSKLKEQALNNINQSTTVADVEKIQQKDKDDIYHFDSKQFILDKAKKTIKLMFRKQLKKALKKLNTLQI